MDGVRLNCGRCEGLAQALKRRMRAGAGAGFTLGMLIASKHIGYDVDEPSAGKTQFA